MNIERNDSVVIDSSITEDEAIENLRRMVESGCSTVIFLKERVKLFEAEGVELRQSVTDLTTRDRVSTGEIDVHLMTIKKLTKAKSLLEGEVMSLKANVPRKGDVVAQMLSANTKQIKELKYENENLRIKVAETSVETGDE